MSMKTIDPFYVAPVPGVPPIHVLEEDHLPSRKIPSPPASPVVRKGSEGRLVRQKSKVVKPKQMFGVAFANPPKRALNPRSPIANRPLLPERTDLNMRQQRFEVLSGSAARQCDWLEAQEAQRLTIRKSRKDEEAALTMLVKEAQRYQVARSDAGLPTGTKMSLLSSDATRALLADVKTLMSEQFFPLKSNYDHVKAELVKLNLWQ